MSDPASPTTVNERETAGPADQAEPAQPLGNPGPAESEEPPTDPAAAAAVIDGRQFAPVANTASGEVGATTVFHYHQDGKVIWAEYSGGAVVRGYLVGTRSGDRMSFRYSHLNIDLQTASGVCETRIAVLDDGRVQFRETWQWESRPEHGTSIVEELAGSGERP